MSANEIFYVLLGLATIGAALGFNRHLYGANGAGKASAYEWACYVIALAALFTGWYFNFQYMRGYGDQVGWWHWTTLLFVNPASASGGQDLIYANVFLFPLWTIWDGRRNKMKVTWWWFVMSVFTSFAFAMALYMAAHARQVRWNGNQK